MRYNLNFIIPTLKKCSLNQNETILITECGGFFAFNEARDKVSEICFINIHETSKIFKGIIIFFMVILFLLTIRSIATLFTLGSSPDQEVVLEFFSMAVIPLLLFFYFSNFLYSKITIGYTDGFTTNYKANFRKKTEIKEIFNRVFRAIGTDFKTFPMKPGIFGLYSTIKYVNNTKVTGYGHFKIGKRAVIRTLGNHILNVGNISLDKLKEKLEN